MGNISGRQFFVDIRRARTFASSSHAKRRFCATCGSYLVFTSSKFPGEVSVNTATFDDPDAFPPRRHIFVGSRISWFRTADDLPRHRGYGESGAVDS